MVYRINLYLLFPDAETTPVRISWYRVLIWKCGENYYFPAEGYIYLAYAALFLYLIGSLNKLSGSNWKEADISLGTSKHNMCVEEHQKVCKYTDCAKLWLIIRDWSLVDISKVIMSYYMSCLIYFKLLPKRLSSKALIHFYREVFWCSTHMSPLVVWAGHIHNPAAGARPLDDRQQQPGEQEVGDEVHPQLVLEPVSCCPVWSVLQHNDHCLHLTLHHPVSGLPWPRRSWQGCPPCSRSPASWQQTASPRRGWPGHSAQPGTPPEQIASVKED